MPVYDVEVFSAADVGDGKFAQGRLLVHGYDDVLWTDDVDAAVAFLRESIDRALNK
jgi:hypothetical protein